jgi:hypothetical protein
MNREELINLCKYDFLTYNDALAFSPYQCDRIKYRKEEEPFVICDLNSYPTNALPATYEIRIQKNSFGFYSWVTNCKDDHALISEYKTKPQFYTEHEIKDTESANFICSTIENIIASTGLLAGVTCMEEFEDHKHFIVGFTAWSLNPAIFLNFSISNEEIAMRDQQGKVNYLFLVTEHLLRDRMKLMQL